MANLSGTNLGFQSSVANMGDDDISSALSAVMTMLATALVGVWIEDMSAVSASVRGYKRKMLPALGLGVPRVQLSWSCFPISKN